MVPVVMALVPVNTQSLHALRDHGKWTVGSRVIVTKLRSVCRRYVHVRSVAFLLAVRVQLSEIVIAAAVLLGGIGDVLGGRRVCWRWRRRRGWTPFLVRGHHG